jgi:putative transcriptional regulator
MQELKRIRNELGWSQQRLADESGVNKATINQVEQGKRSPSIPTLESLARAMSVEVGDFFPKVQAPLWSEDEIRAAWHSGRTIRWADLLKSVGGMAQDLEGRYDAAGENFAQLSTLCWITTRLYQMEDPRARAAPEYIEALDEAEGVLRLGLEMMEQRASEGGAGVTRLDEYRAKTREALNVLRGIA